MASNAVAPINKTGMFALAVAAAAAALILASAANAESLWDHRNASSAFLFTDNVAADVGDSLTVLITDQSSFAKTGKRDLTRTSGQTGTMTLTKTTTSPAGAGTTGGANAATAVVQMLPQLDLKQDSSREFNSDSNFTGSMTFADSITATVIDKLPNGNLVIAGRSERSVAGEDVVTILTGIVKPEDISGSNTATSLRIANFRLFYESNGLNEKYTMMGWLNRIFNYIWPF